MKKLTEEMSATSESSSGSSFFKVKTDNAGNGSAVLRFLPTADLEHTYVEKFSHYYTDEVTGKVLNEMSPRTFKEYGVLDKFVSWLYKQGYEDLGKSLNAKRNYYANVLVLDHKGQEEDVGKVFTYRFGVKIKEKITQMLMPNEALGEEAINVFHPFEGSAFSLKVKQVSGYANYDDSYFSRNVSRLAKTDDEIEAILEKTQDVGALIKKEFAKTDEEMISILNDVLGKNPRWAEYKELMGIEESVSTPKSSPKEAKSDSKVEVKEAKVSEKTPPFEMDDDDEIANIINNL
jgi:hypothetical protein